MSGFLLYDEQDGIATLTMNRPEERNALTEEHQMLEFVEVCERMRRDPKVVLVDEKNRIKDANLVELPGPLKRVG